MDNQEIIGVKEGTDVGNVVNFKQLTSYIDALRITLQSEIKLTQKKLLPRAFRILLRFIGSKYIRYE